MIEILFLAAPLLAVPLGLRILRAPKVFLWIQPAVALLAASSFLFEKGIVAAFLAAPWFAFTASLPFIRQPNISFRMAQWYIPIGGAWLVISRSGFEPLGFTEPIILLTAVHFHYAGFVAPIIAGLVRPPRIIHGGVLVCPPLLAIGITLSPPLELIVALGLAVSLGLTGIWQLRHRNLWLRISSLSAVAGMIFAGLYAFRIVDIPTMAHWHGTIMALGFGMCGLLGWHRNAE